MYQLTETPGFFAHGLEIGLQNICFSVILPLPVQLSLRPARDHSEAGLRGAQDAADAGAAGQLAERLPALGEGKSGFEPPF